MLIDVQRVADGVCVSALSLGPEVADALQTTLVLKTPESLAFAAEHTITSNAEG